MNGKPQMRKVRQFQNDDDLQRELSQFEQDASDAFDGVGQQMYFRFKATSLKTADCQAKLYDTVRCLGTFKVLLPTATKQNDGRAVAVLVEGAGTITVLSVGSNVQGAASEALATTGMRIYHSNGEDWWRAP